MTMEQFFGLYNYWIVVFLMMTGFFIVIARKNMIKTVIGLNIFQTSVVLLYITMGKVTGATAPIIPAGATDAHRHSDHGAMAGHDAVVDHGAGVDHVEIASAPTHSAHADAVHVAHDLAPDYAAAGVAHQVSDGGAILYSNPLPSVLMLTAIVVGIATTALALALIVRISEDYGTIEEDEILKMDRQR